MKDLFAVAVVLLLLAVVFHALPIEHEHPAGIFGEGAQAVFHGEERKLLAMLLVLALFIVRTLPALLQTGRFEQRRLLGQPYVSFDTRKLFDPIRLAFRRGVLNPKICL